MMCPILNAGWLQIGVSAFTVHNAAIPPVPPAPSPILLPGLIEGPAFMGWPPGFLSHRKEATVLVDGNPGVKQGHDIGYVVPHFAIPMNALCAVNTLFSKHKVMFPVSKVLIKGSPAGTYLAFALGQICCNPCSMPTGVVMLIKCTVWTSMTLVDFLKGLGYIALEVAFDFLWNRFFKGNWMGKGSPTPAIYQVLGGLSLREMIAVGGGSLVGKYLLGQVKKKLFEHILKTWIAAPLLRAAPRGNVGLGRGDILNWPIYQGRWW